MTSIRTIVLSCLLSVAPSAAGVAGAAADLSEIDAFMAKVLERRDINWEALDAYVFRESESLALLKDDGHALERRDADYVRFVEDGLLVRSPVRVDGVAVGDEERRRYEAEWKEQETRQRERRRRKRGADQGAADPVVAGATGDAIEPVETPAPSEAEGEPEGEREGERHYFLDLDFEPGSYYFVGRETLDGRDVLRIEYYPQALFSGDGAGTEPRDPVDGEAPRSASSADPRSQARRARQKADEDEIERKLDKTTRVTLWVVEAEHQIVRVEMDNVGLDFLPLKSLVRLRSMRAAMSLHQPVPGVWLPRDIQAHGEVATALGSLAVDYRNRFFDYRKAGVEAEVEFGAPVGAQP